MDTERIDQSLTELMELRWRWQHEGRSPDFGKRVREAAIRLGAEAPEEYREFVNSIPDSMTNTGQENNPHLPVPPQPDSTEPFDDLETFLASVPTEIDHVPDSLLEYLNSRPAQRMASVGEHLPVRNSTTTNAPHVELFTQNNGLIHGGTIHIGSSKLVCRAFRFFRYTLSSAKRETYKVDVVAGVCEQIDASGNVVARWSTAERLAELYKSTSTPLPDYACRWDPALKLLEGFYYPARLKEAIVEMLKNVFKDKKHPRVFGINLPRKLLLVEAPDDGMPDAGYYLGQKDAVRGLYKEGFFFAAEPGPKSAVENAFYNIWPTGTRGYVINTPYLSVFSPSPSLPLVIVSMIGVYREGWFSGKGPSTYKMKKFDRKPTGWFVKSFQLH